MGDKLTARLQEIDVALNNATQQLYMLHGHKAEVLFQIEEEKKADEAIETPVESPVE